MTDPSPDISKLEQQRRQRLAQIQALGIDPYGGRYDGAESAEPIKQRFKDGDDSQRARTAGRIVLLRDIGKLIFITLRDWNGTIQAGLSRQMLGGQWEQAKLLELGDIIGVEGPLGRTPRLRAGCRPGRQGPRLQSRQHAAGGSRAPVCRPCLDGGWTWADRAPRARIQSTRTECRLVGLERPVDHWIARCGTGPRVVAARRKTPADDRVRWAQLLAGGTAAASGADTPR